MVQGVAHNVTQGTLKDWSNAVQPSLTCSHQHQIKAHACRDGRYRSIRHMQCTPRPLNGIIHTPIQVSCIALFDDSIAEPIITRCMVLSPQACFIAEWHAQEQWPIPLKIKRAHNKLANVTRNAEVYSPIYCISSTTCAFCCNTMARHCRHSHPSVVEHTLKQ